MKYTLPEYLRKSSVEALFQMKYFSNSWNFWRPKIRQLTGETISSSSILNLGDHLAEIFTTTSLSASSQLSLSSSNAAWEALLIWYINLCTAGTRIVAVKKMSLVPKPIQSAITVNYGNFAHNTESDITIIIFPDKEDYKINIDSISVKDINENPIELFIKDKFNYEVVVDNLTRRDFGDFGIGIVQCKTNWDNNAQIPMLWDMIYATNGFKGHKITLGREGYSIKDLDTFSYSFATVPLNKNIIYKSESVAVNRVTNLSGGNYWGKPTKKYVARSVKEMFNNNLQSGFNKNLREDLKLVPPLLNKNLDYFIF